MPQSDFPLIACLTSALAFVAVPGCDDKKDDAKADADKGKGKAKGKDKEKGGGKDEPAGDKGKAPKAEGGDAAKAEGGDAAKAEGGDAGAADEPPEAPKPVTPASYDGRDLKASEFAAAFTAWKGKSVVIAGNPVFFFDEGNLKGSVALNADPTKKDDKPVECKMKADDDEKFAKTKVAVLKGTYSEMWGPQQQLRLTGCEKVELVDAMPPEVKDLAPETYDGKTPIPVKQFVGAFAWKDKEVTIIGSFNGSTTSKMKDGTEYIRVDVGDPGAKASVACHLNEAVPKENVGTNKVWKFKGKATGELVFDKPNIVDCVFVEQVK